MDLLNLEPTKIRDNLQGTSIFLYGEAKVGKTSLAAQFPSPIFLSTERGLTALPGIYSQPIGSWSEFKQAVTELSKPAVRERYATVVVDTATNLIDWLDIYCGSAMSTDKKAYKFASEIDYGKGTARMAKELNEQLQKLIKKDYTVILIGHSEEKTDFATREAKVTTSLDKKSGLVVDRFVDSTLYMERDGKNPEGIVHFRGNKKFKAGTRYKFIEPSCTASYEAIEKAVRVALEKEALQNPGFVVSEKEQATNTNIEEPNFDFHELMNEFNSLTKAIVAANPDNVEGIKSICEGEVGIGNKVSTLKPFQAELLAVIVTNLKEKYSDLI